MEREIPYFDEEDFDGEEWDEYAWLIPYLLNGELPFEVWVDLMTPIWREQIENLRKEGWINERTTDS